MRKGGGEPGKLPKEMKKRKRPFPEKRRLLPEGHPQKFFKKTKKVLAFCKKVLYTNEVGCGKQQKANANDTNEYGQLVKGLRRRPLTAETRVRFPYWLLTESNQNMFLVAFLFMITNGDFGRFYYDH